MTDTHNDNCALCGLPLRFGHHEKTFGHQTLLFCCSGCLMVYTMLMEASDAPDPVRFKQSELYRRCVAANVIPANETDLADISHAPTPSMAKEYRDVPKDEMLSLRYHVDGMWCPACAWVIQSALEKVSGVHEAVCDFATDRLRCHYNPIQVDPDTLMGVVHNLGYSLVQTDSSRKRRLWQREFVRLIICALLSINVMMLSWSLYSGFFTSLSPSDIRNISWPLLVMSTLVMIYGGGPLFRKAWAGLRASAPGMETLICIGAGSAYLYSIYNFSIGSFHLYFDTASMLITLVLLGKLLEAKAKAKVRLDLEGFLALQPNKVRLCSPDFPQGRFVALAQLRPGDRFRVQADEMIPADGRILGGQGWVDESAVTGESQVKTVGPDDSLTSGTLLLEGDVTVAARRVGPASLMGQMIAIIESGLARQTRLESRTDRWLALFVPLMVGLAVTTMVIGHSLGLSWTEAFERGLTVLVIACPCALGIAIPLARIGGMSAAGRIGILVRDFEAFEGVNTIDCIVMDKTGTLTQGHWLLSQLAPYGQMTADQALALAAGLEQGVNHAVARSVLSQAQQQQIAPAQVTKIQKHANGISGSYAGHRVKIGTWQFVTPDPPPKQNETLSKVPLSEVYLSIDQKVCATLGFGDQLHARAPALIQYLTEAGLALHLISGDAHTTTREVAHGVGIMHAAGGLLPHEKSAYVARLQANGHRVAMVGDGINDAPALAGADLSVALHRDAALAQQAASVTLMRSDPAQLIDFFNLAKQVNRKVAQNLGCAWVYNLIGIPVAMSGWLNPLVAVIAMLMSSLTVIGNTLLLVRKKGMNSLDRGMIMPVDGE